MRDGHVPVTAPQTDQGQNVVQRYHQRQQSGRAHTFAILRQRREAVYGMRLAIVRDGVGDLLSRWTAGVMDLLRRL
jgi:hypothetical protein